MTTKGEVIQGLKCGEPHIYKARLVTLPSGRKLPLFWYVPDGYTVSGKLKDYAPTALDREDFRKREAAFRLEMANRQADREQSAIKAAA